MLLYLGDGRDDMIAYIEVNSGHIRETVEIEDMKDIANIKERAEILEKDSSV